MQKSGIILLNKPTGMTSNTAVNVVKRLVGAKKAGHLGTLDPFGTGVLPITLNKATRLFDYFLKKRKQYRAIFRFGIETDTFDSEGGVTKIDKGCLVDENKLSQVVDSMIGRQMQIPPKYSAKKINGKKAYELARQGDEFELKPKEVEIFDFKIIKKFSENEFLFEIDCSEGTYIRSVCRDLSTKLSTCGAMLAICRTICGDMQLRNTINIEEISENFTDIISIDKALDLETIMLNEEQMRDLLCGKKVYNSNLIASLCEFKLKFQNDIVGVGHFADNCLIVDCFLYEGEFDGRKY